MISVDKPSLVKVVSSFNKFARENSREVHQALYKEATLLLQRSKAIVPYKTGYLLGSAFVATDLAARARHNISMIVGYTAPYAFEVHENNKNYNNGKQWKFLETPFQKTSQGFNEKISRRVRVALKKAKK